MKNLTTWIKDEVGEDVRYQYRNLLKIKELALQTSKYTDRKTGVTTNLADYISRNFRTTEFDTVYDDSYANGVTTF